MNSSNRNIDSFCNNKVMVTVLAVVMEILLRYMYYKSDSNSNSNGTSNNNGFDNSNSSINSISKWKL